MEKVDESYDNRKNGKWFAPIQAVFKDDLSLQEKANLLAKLTALLDKRFLHVSDATQGELTAATIQYCELFETPDDQTSNIREVKDFIDSKDEKTLKKTFKYGEYLLVLSKWGDTRCPIVSVVLWNGKEFKNFKSRFLSEIQTKLRADEKVFQKFVEDHDKLPSVCSLTAKPYLQLKGMLLQANDQSFNNAPRPRRVSVSQGLLTKSEKPNFGNQFGSSSSSSQGILAKFGKPNFSDQSSSSRSQWQSQNSSSNNDYHSHSRPRSRSRSQERVEKTPKPNRFSSNPNMPKNAAFAPKPQESGADSKKNLGEFIERDDTKKLAQILNIVELSNSLGVKASIATICKLLDVKANGDEDTLIKKIKPVLDTEKLDPDIKISTIKTILTLPDSKQ